MDDISSHNKVVLRKPLPPTPPLNSKVDGTNVDSTKCSIAQHSPTTCKKSPPPSKAENNSQPPNKSPKPPIIPRKTYPVINQTDSTVRRPKPPLPRKPHTVYGSNRAGPPVPRKPNIISPRLPTTPNRDEQSRSKPLELSGLLQKTAITSPRPPADLHRGDQYKVKVLLMKRVKVNLPWKRCYCVRAWKHIQVQL